MAKSESERRSVLWNLLVVLIGQVGCITLVVILGSVRLGLWLDARFETRPLYTLGLLFAGIPLSVFLMLLVARKTLRRLINGDTSQDKGSP